MNIDKECRRCKEEKHLPGLKRGRVSIPPDQVNRNAATSYEAALALLALLTRAYPPILVHATYGRVSKIAAQMRRIS